MWVVHTLLPRKLRIEILYFQGRLFWLALFPKVYGVVLGKWKYRLRCIAHPHSRRPARAKVYGGEFGDWPAPSLYTCAIHYNDAAPPAPLCLLHTLTLTCTHYNDTTVHTLQWHCYTTPYIDACNMRLFCAKCRQNAVFACYAVFYHLHKETYCHTIKVA